LEEKTFIEKLTSDPAFTASMCEGLLQRPKALRQLIAHKEVTAKLIEDPVFFAMLMCGDKWLIQAPEHQKLLQDASRRQVAVCGRGWAKAWFLAEKTSGSYTPSPKWKASSLAARNVNP
jgi:hypothetical protein